MIVDIESEVRETLNRSEKGSIYRIYSRIDLDALKHNVDRIKQC